MPSQAHAFGGRWTDVKLVRVLRYLDAYMTVMKNQSFSLGFIDAFAGTGFRLNTASGPNSDPSFLDVDDLQIGSAAAALKVTPPFHLFWFIEKRKKFYDELCKLRASVPSGSKAEFINDDANVAIARICSETNWRNTRAVAFLDPYGMQVNWATIEKIAATKAIDMWWLFPSHMGVGRMLPRDGKVPDRWKHRLDEALGTDQWLDAFYQSVEQDHEDLFDGKRTRLERVFDVTSIEKFVTARLKAIFPGVAPRPVQILINNRPAYQLYFAMANPSEKARARALSIASWIIEHKLRLFD